MGDHRATINIRVEFHGKVYEWKDAWINYNGHNGIDERVVNFFEKMWEDGYARWMAETHKYERQQKAVETERSERELLEKLKRKYEGR